MFCPKCGTENPETGKFCRACGTDLENVSTALSGNLKPAQPTYYIDEKGKMKSNDPSDIWGAAVKNIIMGIGFLVVAIVLLSTNVAGGKAWWWAMLFPAFSMLGVGISNIIKVKKMEQYGQTVKSPQKNQLPDQSSNYNLPPIQTDFVKPQKSIYETGELIEAQTSVTEGTTRHLEVNKEGETITLPKI